jgi:hypothetical protein
MTKFRNFLLGATAVLALLGGGVGNAAADTCEGMVKWSSGGYAQEQHERGVDLAEIRRINPTDTLCWFKDTTAAGKKILSVCDRFPGDDTTTFPRAKHLCHIEGKFGARREVVRADKVTLVPAPVPVSNDDDTAPDAVKSESRPVTCDGQLHTRNNHGVVEMKIGDCTINDVRSELGKRILKECHPADDDDKYLYCKVIGRTEGSEFIVDSVEEYLQVPLSPACAKLPPGTYRLEDLPELCGQKNQHGLQGPR